MRRHYRLDALCDIRSGGTPPRSSSANYGGNFPWAKIDDLNVGSGVVSSTKEYITEIGLQSIRGRLFEPGTLLFAMYGSVGKMAWAGVRLATNQAILGISVLEPQKLAPSYLKHWLVSKQADFDRDANGVTQKNLSAGYVRDLEIELPPIEEQQRIATILDKADGLRRKRQEAIRLADEFLRAVFFEMFGDLTANPYAWPEVSLGDVIQDGPRNGLYCPSEVYGSGVPILRIDGFYNGEIVNGYQFKRVQIDDSTKARFSLMDDSVVLNRVNSREFVGKAAHVINLEEPTVFESNMMNFSVDRNRIDTYFLVQQLQSAFIRNQIARARKDAVNQSSINQEDVKGLRVLVPPISAQERFRKIADYQMRLRSRLEQSKKALVNAQDSLSFALLGEYSSR